MKGPESLPGVVNRDSISMGRACTTLVLEG